MTDPTTHTAAAERPFDRQHPAHHDRSADADERTDTPAATSSETAMDTRGSEFVTHGDPTLTQGGTDPVAQRPGVQWVRPTDLAARAGGAVLDRGAELNTRLRDAVLGGVREGRAQLQERLARRQESLEPESSSPTSAREGLVGRTGVSR